MSKVSLECVPKQVVVVTSGANLLSLVVLQSPEEMFCVRVTLYDPGLSLVRSVNQHTSAINTDGCNLCECIRRMRLDRLFILPNLLLGPKSALKEFTWTDPWNRLKVFNCSKAPLHTYFYNVWKVIHGMLT
jgi:hypothetical protein